MFDTVNRSISIPDNKLQEKCRTCSAWSNKTIVTKNELQSLLGLLLYITKCVRPARYFLNRMLQLLRDSHNDQNIYLTAEFFKDLKWFQVFFLQWYHILPPTPLHKRIYLDASLEGLGGCYDNSVYALRIPRGFKDYNIAHLEILNVGPFLGQ